MSQVKQLELKFKELNKSLSDLYIQLFNQLPDTGIVIDLDEVDTDVLLVTPKGNVESAQFLSVDRKGMLFQVNGKIVEKRTFNDLVDVTSKLHVLGQIENQLLMQSKVIAVRVMLTELFNNIGINQPSNFNEILEFIVNDINETAHPVDWHSGDVAIAFRRWIERNDEA